VAMTSTLLTIALFVEGTFLPSMEGATRRFVGTARNLTALGHRVVVIHCYRGWSDLRLIATEKFTTYAVTPDVYYGDIPRLVSILRSESVAIAQFAEIETICSIGIPIKRLAPNMQLAYECHDVHSEFLSSLGAPPSDINRVREMEQNALPLCDLITCFTLEDRNVLLKRGACGGRTFVVPFGIELDGPKATAYSPHGRKIVFLGNLYHRPNQSSVKLIVTAFAPAMRALNVDCTFTVVGDFPKSFENEMRDPDVKFVGQVDHLADVLTTMTLAVAPVIDGTGIKVKMLDYFAAGLPTIGTSLGFRGYPSGAGVVIDELDAFPRIISELLDNSRRLSLISHSARVIAETHDWKKIRRELSQLYADAVRNPLNIRDRMLDAFGREPSTARPYVLVDNITQSRFKVANYQSLARGMVVKSGGHSEQ